MISHLSNNWLLIAFLAPALWALVNIMDVYFVEKIYEHEHDGAIMTGFSQIIPWLTVPFIGLVVPDSRTILLAIFGGALIVISQYFYFKALFITSDATLILILWNAIAIAVPILAFLFLKEKLSIIQYCGIIITFLGAIYLTLDKKIGKKNIAKVILIMIGVVLLWSLSMVAAKSVYSRTTFQGGIMFTSLGAVLTGMFFYVIRTKRYGAKNLIKIGKKYFGWFIFSEIMTLTGIVTSQRAIDLSPAVSFVAVIESIQPAFIIILSVAIFLVISNFSNKNKEVSKKIYNDQLAGIGSKIYAMIVMAIGIYLINI